MKFIRKRISKPLAVFTLFNILNMLVFPVNSFALTGGPSQPETQGFQQVGTSDMVDLFSGDFSYNIPLMDVGGYPINIGYSSSVNTDMEASWVGLGWSLSPGAINRTVRGVPDDFKGDGIKREYNRKPSKTVSVGLGVTPEAIGIEFLNLAKDIFGATVRFSLGVDYNSYTGVGASFGVTPSLSASKGNKGSLNLSLGLSASSSQGVGISPNLSYSRKTDADDDAPEQFGASIGVPFNSRQGLSTITVGIRDESLPQGLKTSATFNTFAKPAHTHNTAMPVFNGSASFEGALGGELFGLEGEVDFDGAISTQIIKKKRTQDAYGYLYEQDAGITNLLDYNRENDGPISEERPYLPFATHTHDIYAISGQGVGGSYRPYRHDVGIVYDPLNSSLDDAGVNLGFALEVGLGNIAKGGGSTNVGLSKSIVGPWILANSARTVFNFKDQKSLDDEIYYMDQPGDKKVDTDIARFERLGGDKAVHIKLNNVVVGAHASKTITDGSNEYRLSENQTVRSGRAIRNQPVSFLTAEEANKTNFAIESTIYTQGQNDFSFDASSQSYTKNNNFKVRRIDGVKKSHHTSEVKVTREDGARYIYGLPVYNIKKNEISFSVSDKHEPDCITGLISYDTDDLTTDNKNGNDWLYDNTETPAYATSHLLTAVLSSDYVDMTGNGPSPDDLGSYTKFNYHKNGANYIWRTPYEKARFNPGMLHVGHDYGDSNSEDIRSDDKASIIYGEKEMYYLHSIETKTHVAEFTITKRLDALGAADRDFEVNGTNGSDYSSLISRGSKKLDKIDLFTKEEKNRAAVDASYTAVPIKSVHFQYDYSLCPGIDNSATRFNNFSFTDNQVVSALESVLYNKKSPSKAKLSGKLTLRKIYFTYEDSNKGFLNKYKFDYGEENPSYNPKANDRWGNYKQPYGEESSCYDPLSMAAVEEFPYTLQDETVTNKYAKSWLLHKIDLPSGGNIEVDYEADSYAYVQDKEAMQMFKVIGASDRLQNSGSLFSVSDISNAELYNSNLVGNKYLFFKLADPIVAELGQANRMVRERYDRGIDDFFFKFFLKLDVANNKYEYVPGYTKLEGNRIGVVPINGKGTTYEYGYVELERRGVRYNEKGDQDVNPISKAGWQFARKNTPKLAYGVGDPDSQDLGTELIEAIAGSLKSVLQTVKGINRSLRNEGMARDFDPTRSYIRLHEPSGNKLGGGTRVKSVKLYDNWNLMSDGETEDAFYGQEYDYTKETTVGSERVTISSGVAAYEPALGGEENPFKKPVSVGKDHRFLVPGLGEYLEEPFGESFFPGASVGYSKVTVSNIDKTGLGEAENRRTGKTVHEFYTARDFPTKVDRTLPQMIRSNPLNPFKFFKKFSNDFFAASQGYLVELNNMHGKQKSQRVFKQGDASALSGVDYNYVVGNNGITNEVKVLNNKGEMSNAKIGLDYDIITDMRSSTDISLDVKVDIDVDGFLLGIIPLAIPSIMPGVTSEVSTYKSASMMKVINRSGILKETVAYDLGAQISTENLVWDAKTGNVLLTKTKNSFQDEIYSFNYPAHWQDDRMGFAYENIGLRVDTRDYNPTLLQQFLGTAPVGNSNWDVFQKMFAEGDELGVSLGTSNKRVWVVSNGTGNNLVLRDRAGNIVNTSDIEEFIILRSGRRNMQSASVGAVTMLNNPLLDTDGDGDFDAMDFDFSEVLDASATVYKDLWKIYCNCEIDPTSDQYNPFATGERGNYKAFKSFLYLSERTQTWENNNTNIRKDGVFTDFQPFWNEPITTGLWYADSTKWQFTTEITECSPYGFELENKDALGRFSGAIYGYRNTLPTAVANNSKYREIGFDNFEDYLESEECVISDHFSFREALKENPDAITNEEAHSGRHSVKVLPNKPLSVSKDLINCN